MREINIILSILMTYLGLLGLCLVNRENFDILFTQPVNAIQVLQNRSTLKEAEFHPSYYQEATTDLKGVTVYNHEKTEDGYIFFADGDKLGATLMGMDGNVIHSWEKTPREIWGATNPYVNEIPEATHTTSRAFLNPEDGSVFLIYSGWGMNPYNYFGFVKLDRDSNIVGDYPDYIHHDIEFLPDGKIYALKWNVVTQTHQDFPSIKAPFLDNTLVVLDQDLNFVKEISLFDLMANSRLRVVLDYISNMPLDPNMPPGDIFHINSIEYISLEAAGKAPMLREGQVMLSFRNLDLLVILDVENEEITWASYGPWKGQHHPEILDDGSVLMFDNQGHLGEGGATRALNVDLNDLSVIWEYTGTDDNPFFSKYIGAVEPLPNSNVLISDSGGGRLIEVTRDKEIVWEYRMPARLKAKTGETLIPAVFSGKKYTADELKFLSRN